MRGRRCGGGTHLLHSVQHVLLGDGLASRADREHAGLRAHRPDLRARGVRAQACQELVPDTLVHVHAFAVDRENVLATLQIRQAELHLQACKRLHVMAHTDASEANAKALVPMHACEQQEPRAPTPCGRVAPVA